MHRNLVVAGILTACVAATSACYKFTRETSTASPSAASAVVLGGLWGSTQSLPGGSGSLQDTCTNFSWSVTEVAGSTAAGVFSATCFGNMQISGSARGTIAGSLVTWTASAVAVGAGAPTCAIALQGTAQFSANEIRIPYTGTTCFGPISGTEVLGKK